MISLVPVIDIFSQSQEIVDKYNFAVPHIAFETSADIQDYIEWPLRLSKEARLSLSDEVYEAYRDVTEVFAIELEDSIEGKFDYILVQNY